MIKITIKCFILHNILIILAIMFKIFMIIDNISLIWIIMQRMSRDKNFILYLAFAASYV